MITPRRKITVRLHELPVAAWTLLVQRRCLEFLYRVFSCKPARDRLSRRRLKNLRARQPNLFNSNAKFRAKIKNLSCHPEGRTLQKASATCIRRLIYSVLTRSSWQQVRVGAWISWQSSYLCTKRPTCVILHLSTTQDPEILKFHWMGALPPIPESAFCCFWH